MQLLYIFIRLEFLNDPRYKEIFQWLFFGMTWHGKLSTYTLSANKHNIRQNFEYHLLRWICIIFSPFLSWRRFLCDSKCEMYYLSIFILLINCDELWSSLTHWMIRKMWKIWCYLPNNLLWSHQKLLSLDQIYPYIYSLGSQITIVYLFFYF